MKLTTSTLRPGLLVSLTVSSRGDVRYDKVDLDEHAEATGESVAKWETTRTIADAREFEQAKKVQIAARYAIARVCASSAFGLLCPEDNADRLEQAVQEAQAMVDAFNSTASITRVNLYVMTGRIAQDDVEAVRKINREIRELMDDMAAGMKNLDIKVIRDAATRASGVGKMLSPDAQARVQLAVDVARKAATEIKAAGEAAAIKVDQYAISQVTAQRTAFLDMSDEVEVARPEATARAIDMSATE